MPNPDWTVQDQLELERLEAAFEEAGGRGVELAERIDQLRATRDAEPKPYRLEVRKDFMAISDAEALAKAGRFASIVDGELTAVFNEEWEEVQ